jgi:hypothetical protein
MAQTVPPNMIVLHCEIEVDGQALWADTLIPQETWDAADETTRQAFRERAREALTGGLVRHYQAAIDGAAVTAIPAPKER